MNDLQTLLVTVLGTLLGFLAIWPILVRREPDRNTAKFLGIEINLSTPGVVVLAIGSRLLVLPAFVPHRDGGLPGFASSSGNHR